MESDSPFTYWVRHGETVWNVLGKYQGNHDSPLTAFGRQQALISARFLRRGGIRRLYTSPMRRAVETAAVFAEVLGLSEVRADDRLREIGYGQWEGLTQEEVRSRWPEQLRAWKRAPHLAAIPGAESLQLTRARLLDFSRDPTHWSKRDDGVAVITHAGCIRLLHLEQRRTGLAAFRNIRVPHASIWPVAMARHFQSSAAPILNKEPSTCASQ